MFGLTGQDVILTGLPLAGVLLVAFAVTMLSSGAIGVAIERLSLAAVAQRQGAGGDDHHDRRVVYPVQHHPAGVRRGCEELSQPDADGPLRQSAARCWISASC